MHGRRTLRPEDMLAEELDREGAGLGHLSWLSGAIRSSRRSRCRRKKCDSSSRPERCGRLPARRERGKKQAALVAQLQSGKVLRFEYTRSQAPERAAIELDSFKEAYAELLRERGQKGSTSWSATDSAASSATKAETTKKAEPPNEEKPRVALYEIGPPVAPAAGADVEALVRYLKARESALRACLKRVAAGALGQKAGVQFNIESSGRAIDVAVEDISDDSASKCLEAVFRAWVFPLKPDGVVPVFVPVHAAKE